MYLLKQPWPSGQGGGILTVLQFFFAVETSQKVQIVIDLNNIVNTGFKVFLLLYCWVFSISFWS